MNQVILPKAHHIPNNLIDHIQVNNLHAEPQLTQSTMNWTDHTLS